MENQTTATPSRIHPLMAGAAASVILVSLLGVAAITGVIPSSHGTVAPSVAAEAVQATQATNAVQPAQPYLSANVPTTVQQDRTVGTDARTERYVTRDGKILEIVPGSQAVTQVQQARVVADAAPAPVVHHVAPHRHTQHRSQQYAQNSYAAPAPRNYQQPVYQQPAYQQESHPIRNYVSDMHPVGTGVGAVVGGVLGNQVGGGNGKKVATVAGALLGGYAGNEVAHNRNPLAW